MSVFDAWFDGATHAHARRSRELAVENGQTLARGFNMILSRLDEIGARLERLEAQLSELHPPK